MCDASASAKPRRVVGPPPRAQPAHAHVHVGANAGSAGGTPDRAALRCTPSGRRHRPDAGCTLYAAQPQDTPCRCVWSPGRFPRGPATWYACPGATLHGPQRAQWRIRFCPPLVRSAGSPRHCVRSGAAPRETTGKHHGSSGRSVAAIGPACARSVSVAPAAASVGAVAQGCAAPPPALQAPGGNGRAQRVP